MANLIQGVHHIALKATDFDRSLAFYRGLGFRPTMEWGSAGEQDTRAAMLDSGDGSCIELFAGGSRQQPGSWFHLAFRVPDCDAACRRAKFPRNPHPHRLRGRARRRGARVLPIPVSSENPTHRGSARFPCFFMPSHGRGGGEESGRYSFRARVRLE